MKKLLILIAMSLCHFAAMTDPQGFDDKHRRSILKSVEADSTAIYRFFDLIIEPAQNEMLHRQILPSITMAQAILETGYGNSELARRANNYFGMKGIYNGCKYAYKNDDYRCYNDLKASFIDHSNHLRKKPEINKLIRDYNKDFNDWVRALVDINYATDPLYADKLIDIIKRYKLYRYDYMVANEVPAEQSPSFKNREIRMI